MLNIEINPSLVDVNVHPAKTEVRFSDERVIFNAIFYACKNALSAGDAPKQIKEISKDFYKAPEKPPEQLKITAVPSPKNDFWQHIPKSEPEVKVTQYEPKPVFDNKPPVTAAVAFKSPEPETVIEEKIEDILLNSQPKAEIAEPVAPEVPVSEEKQAFAKKSFCL